MDDQVPIDYFAKEHFLGPGIEGVWTLSKLSEKFLRFDCKFAGGGKLKFQNILQTRKPGATVKIGWMVFAEGHSPGYAHAVGNEALSL